MYIMVIGLQLIIKLIYVCLNNLNCIIKKLNNIS